MSATTAPTTPYTTTLRVNVPHASFDLEAVPAEHRQRVAALIPGYMEGTSEAIAAGYVHRTIEGVYDYDYLDAAMHDLENMLLIGPTGSSKTTLYRTYAAARQLPFVVIDSQASMDLGTVIGRTGTRPDGTIGWIDGEMLLVVRYGGVLLIDEVNMVHARVNAGYHQLLSVLRAISVPENGETVKWGSGCLGTRNRLLLGAAMNPRYEGVTRLNQAFKNRLAVKHVWDYDREVEEQLVHSATLLDTAYMIRSLAEIRSPVATNLLMEYEYHVWRHGSTAAVRMLINSFEPEEQGPVARALEAQSARIEGELAGYLAEQDALAGVA